MLSRRAKAMVRRFVGCFCYVLTGNRSKVKLGADLKRLAVIDEKYPIIVMDVPEPILAKMMGLIVDFTGDIPASEMAVDIYLRAVDALPTAPSLGGGARAMQTLAAHAVQLALQYCDVPYRNIPKLFKHFNADPPQRKVYAAWNRWLFETIQYHIVDGTPYTFAHRLLKSRQSIKRAKDLALCLCRAPPLWTQYTRFELGVGLRHLARDMFTKTGQTAIARRMRAYLTPPPPRQSPAGRRV